VILTPMALEIDRRDLTNRVCRDALCSGYVLHTYPHQNRRFWWGVLLLDIGSYLNAWR
jgi:hypothetical protein